MKDVWFDYDNAVLQQQHVLELIEYTTGRCKDSSQLGLKKCSEGEAKVFPGKNDYIIFHVLNWNGSAAPQLTVSKQNWYVYSNDPQWDYIDFTSARIYGKKQVYLYTIHLNIPAGVIYEERYVVDEKSKTPAYLNNLIGIGQLFGITPGGTGLAEAAVADGWFAFRLDVKYVPSDLVITPVMTVQSAQTQAQQQPTGAAPSAPTPPAPASLGPPPETVAVPGTPPAPPAPRPPAAAPPPKDQKPAVKDQKPAAGDQKAVPATAAPATAGANASVTLDAKTFDNEGKYHIDFSVGVPITKITQLSYVQTTNSLAPASVNKQSIFALLDYYPVAVDVKNTILPKYPYLLTGVAIGSQPLQKVLFGVGWGPLFANFYAALLLNTEKAPSGWSCGDKLPTPAAGAALANHTCPQFNFGLNVGVAAIADALKNKAKPSGSASNK